MELMRIVGDTNDDISESTASLYQKIEIYIAAKNRIKSIIFFTVNKSSLLSVVR
jgi:hypothetical protein